MTEAPRRPTHDEKAVLFDGERVLIRDLSVDGALALLAAQAVETGRDLEVLVLQALEIGAAVLLHGSAKWTVDAVSAEVNRLLDALDAKGASLALVRRNRDRIAAKGFVYEDSVAPVLESCFAPH